MPIAGIYGPDDFGNPVHSPPAAKTRTRISPAERARSLPMPSLEWTPEVERATTHLYERVKNVISPIEWPFIFFQAKDGIRDDLVTGVQTCALPICGEFR